MTKSGLPALFHELRLAGLTRIPRQRLGQVETILENLDPGLDRHDVRRRVARAVVFSADELAIFEPIFDDWYDRTAAQLESSSALPAAGPDEAPPPSSEGSALALPPPPPPPPASPAPPGEDDEFAVAEALPVTEPPSSGAAPNTSQWIILALLVLLTFGATWLAARANVFSHGLARLLADDVTTVAEPDIGPVQETKTDTGSSPTTDPDELQGSPRDDLPQPEGADDPSRDRENTAAWKPPGAAEGGASEVPATEQVGIGGPGGSRGEATSGPPTSSWNNSRTIRTRSRDAGQEPGPTVQGDEVSRGTSGALDRGCGRPSVGCSFAYPDPFSLLAFAVILSGLSLLARVRGEDAGSWLRRVLLPLAFVVVVGGAAAAVFLAGESIGGALEYGNLPDMVLDWIIGVALFLVLIWALRWFWPTLEDPEADASFADAGRVSKAALAVAAVLLVSGVVGSWVGSRSASGPGLGQPSLSKSGNAAVSRFAEVGDPGVGSRDTWFVLRGAPILRVEDRPRTETWWLVVAGLAAAVLGGLMMFVHLSLHRLPRVRPQPGALARTVRRDAHPRPVQREVLGAAAVCGAAGRFSHLRGHGSLRLDIDATVGATARAGGWLDLRFRPAAPPPEVWFWVDQAIDDPLLGRVVDQAHGALRRVGVPVRVAVFYRVPTSLKWLDGPRFNLVEAEGRALHARIVVFSDGGELTTARREWRPGVSWRLLRSWPDVTVVDFGFGLGRRLALAVGLPVVSPQDLPAVLGADHPQTGPAEAPLPAREVAHLPGIARRALTVLAMSDRPVTEATAGAVLSRLDLGLSPWEWRRLTTLLGGSPLSLTAGERAILLNRYLKDGERSAATSAWQELWLRRMVGSEVESRLWNRMEHAWLGMWLEEPSDAIHRLFQLRGSADIARELQCRMEQYCPAEVDPEQATLEGRIRFPWRLNDRTHRVAHMLRVLGWSERPLLKTTATPELMILEGLSLGLGIVLCAVGMWRLIGPPAVIPSDGSGMAVTIGGPRGERVSVVTVGGQRGLEHETSGHRVFVEESSRRVPVGCVQALDGATLHACGQLPGGTGAEQVFSHHQRVVIAASGVDAEDLAAELIERGSAEVVLTGVWAERNLERLTEGLGADDRLLVIARSADDLVRAPPGIPTVRIVHSDLAHLVESIRQAGDTSATALWSAAVVDGRDVDFRLVRCAPRSWKPPWLQRSGNLRRICGAGSGSKLPGEAWWVGRVPSANCEDWDRRSSTWLRGSTSGRYLLSIDQDGDLVVWRGSSGHRYSGQDFVAGAVSDDGGTVAVLSSGGGVWLSQETGRLSHVWSAPRVVSSMELSPTGSTLWLGSPDGTIGAWQTRPYTRRHPESARLGSLPVVALRSDPQGESLAVGTADGRIVVLDAAALTDAVELNSEAGACGEPELRFDSAGEALVVSSGCTSGEVWTRAPHPEPAVWTMQRLSLDEDTTLSQLQWLPGSQDVAGICGDAICVWDAVTGSLVVGPGGHGIASLAFLVPDGTEPSTDEWYTLDEAGVLERQGHWFGALRLRSLTSVEAAETRARLGIDSTFGYCALSTR